MNLTTVKHSAASSEEAERMSSRAVLWAGVAAAFVHNVVVFTCYTPDGLSAATRIIVGQTNASGNEAWQ